MQDMGIFKGEGSKQLTPEEILKQGRLFEVGIKAEWYKNLLKYDDSKLSELCSQLVFTDHESLEDVRFLQGQVIGILDVKVRPEKIIQLRKEELVRREEAAKKKKAKEKKHA